MDEINGGSDPGTDFIRQRVCADVASLRYDGRVVTRFPPEPNGYLHIGHAKSICLNFGLAEEFDGQCHLRYDDTNPETENEEFVRAIQSDIRWLGFDWGEHLYFASDYFERMYESAIVLIEKGLAYVDSQDGDAIRDGRGSVTEAGVASPDRKRSVEENLALFGRMRTGEFEDGAHVLRAKIDMASPNMLMRDPVLYRIRHAHHYRQGDVWCVYPLYDYAHCLEDAYEGVTHSICTLEFENNRELYDWVLDNVGFEDPRSHQYEFAPLDLENAVLSKRRIKPLIEAGIVSGWDDPRLSTIAGLRRRGVPASAVRRLSDLTGVSRTDAVTEESKFDFVIREVLNTSAPRVMAVLEPLKIVLTNYPDDESEYLDAPYYPHDVPLKGSRTLPFSREILMERSDFEEEPPEGFRRLVPGGEVRLRHAYIVRCHGVVKDADGHVVELNCTYDPDTLGASTPDGQKAPGVIHWVSSRHAKSAEVRLFTALFDEEEEVDGDLDVIERVNPASRVVLTGAKVEPSVAEDDPSTRYQFERTGYFWRDPVDGVDDDLVFNRIVALKSTYHSKVEVKLVDTSADETKKGPSVRPVVSDERASARTEDPILLRRFDHYRTELGLSPEHSDLLTGARAISDFFEAALAAHDDAQSVAGWMVTELRGLVGTRAIDELLFRGGDLGALVALVADGTVSRRAAKDVLARMVEEGGDPAMLVEEMGLRCVIDDVALGVCVDSVLAAWPEKVDEYRGGRKSLVGLFVGETMKAMKGAADPKVVRALLIERLEP